MNDDKTKRDEVVNIDIDDPRALGQGITQRHVATLRVLQAAKAQKEPLDAAQMQQLMLDLLDNQNMILLAFLHLFRDRAGVARRLVVPPQLRGVMPRG